MSYLLPQMFIYLLVAFLLGLILGWLIWRYGQTNTGDYEELKAQRDKLIAERNDLRTNLDSCRNRSTLDREASEKLRADKIDLQNRIDAMMVERDAALTAAPVAAAAAPVAAAAAAVPTAAVKGTKPEGLSAPRGGKADDLQQINGVGPKMEKLLYDLGYYHFDQIGDWNASEVAWVDENLEGFKGRVTRDDWITQAKKLARG